jgi:8-oxo-dGDP phosphatase
MPAFELVGADRLFTGFVFSLERRFVRYGGEVFDREVVTHPGAVAVVALDASGDVVLLRQYRASIDEVIYEIPAGTCDADGEDRASTAKRELREETGFDAESWECLGAFYNSPGYSSQATTLYLATGLTLGARAPAGIEETASEVAMMPLGDALSLVGVGKILDMTTALALALLSSHGN